MQTTQMDALKRDFSFPGYRLVDLSYTFEVGMPSWPTHPHYFSNAVEWYENGSYFNQVSFCEHNGTHLDAPAHFVPGGAGVDALEPAVFFSRALIVDLFADYGEEHWLTKAHLQDWETGHGEIQRGDMVFVRFGMDRKYALQPNQKPFLEKWGGVSKEAAEYLVEKGVGIVGTDTLCIDAYDNPDNDAHNVFLKNGVLVIENLARLHELPPAVGVAALPLKFKGGSGSPVRVIAFVPEGE